MRDDELQELQDPATWEDDGDVRPPVKASRAVVSVAFGREDFERVTEEARRRGMKTSEFIRTAALERLEGPRVTTRIVSVGGLAYNDYPMNRTRGPMVTGAPIPDLVSG